MCKLLLGMMSKFAIDEALNSDGLQSAEYFFSNAQRMKETKMKMKDLKEALYDR